jgi:hypothetical protein
MCCPNKRRCRRALAEYGSQDFYSKPPRLSGVIPLRDIYNLLPHFASSCHVMRPKHQSSPSSKLYSKLHTAMGDKRWFVVPHGTDYPPPTLSDDPDERSEGPICLGHIITSLKEIDYVINRKSGPLPYPADMPILQSKQTRFKWDVDKGDNVNLSGTAPILVAPVTMETEVEVAFKRSVWNYWEFDTLDTIMIQPTLEYVEDSLEDEQVQRALRDKKPFGSSSWAVYMISGIKIARGASMKQSESRKRGAGGGAGVNVPGLVEMNARVDVSTAEESSAAYKQETDFPWALKLTKISKRLLESRLRLETEVKGATFSRADDATAQASLQTVLAEGGLEVGDAVGDKFIHCEDDLFIIQE